MECEHETDNADDICDAYKGKETFFFLDGIYTREEMEELHYQIERALWP